MNFRNHIKVIFFVFTLINLTPSIKAVEFNNFKGKNFSKVHNVYWLDKVLPENIKNLDKIRFKEFKSNSNSANNNLKNLNNNSLLLLAKSLNRKDELEIQSQIQSEENNILFAEGNVLVSYKGIILKADTLIYDKTNKILKAKGNVSLDIRNQIFKMVSFEYDFKNETGYLSEVKGLIKTNNLITDLFSNFKTSDIKNIEILKEIKKDKVLHTPNKVENWVFFTDKIEIDGKKWKSIKAIFTNDLLEQKQIKIEINSLEVFSRKEELRFKSSLNYLIFEEKFSIPFWIGERTLTKLGESFANRWNLGFDNLDRDGYFIGRKFNTINLFNDFFLDLEPQFLVQRSLKGYTNSFVNKGDSITGNKVKRDATFVDYFSLNSQLKGKLNNWDLEIDNQLYSFDSEKFSDALRFKTTLNKEITFLNSKWDKSFFGVYRDRIWNGSIGEAEIYTGYGLKLEKQNTWEVNRITKTENLFVSFANFQGEALNSKSLVTSFKGNFFYSLTQKFPINIDKNTNKYIDSSYKYVSQPIKKGVSLNTKVELLYSLYENNNYQEYIGFGAGPEFVLGNFKNKSFDYTRISLLPFYKIKSGKSLFKFDQISDKFSLDIAFDQQLFGPLILKSNATLNLDNDSEDYGDFINSKISLNWQKRSYEIGVFYQHHNEAGGILFTLYGFK